MNDIDALRPHRPAEIEDFFATYKVLEAKESVVQGWGNRDEAPAILARYTVA